MNTTSGRIAETFDRLRAKGGGLVAYVTSGDPDASRSAEILIALGRAGADVIEVGVPFSDPLADGATIQAANQVALANGITLGDCFGFVRDARAAGLNVPVLLMGYYNPILAYGEARAVPDAAAA